MARPLTASQKAALAAEKARQAAAAAKKNKPKPTPSAGRRTNPKAAKPKPPAAKPTRPALPPGRPGGALATRPPTQSTRQANARAQLRDASRGSTGPNRVGQPAGSANRMFGANVVNRSVNRAVTQTNLRGALAKGTAPTAIAGALLNAQAEFKKLQALLRNPKGALSRASSDILSGKPYDPQTVTKASKPATPMPKPKPAPSAGRRTNPKAAEPAKPKPQRQGPPVPARLANSPKPANLSKPTPKPKPSSATTPTRSSTPARPAASRPAASRPAATPAKAKPPAASATSAERRVSASTSNRESGNYGTSKTNNPLMKDMVARMKAREDKAQAAAASKLTYKPNKDSGYTPKDKVKGSKDYSSQFKDMKGGSSRFAAELKKKKKGYKLF